MTDQPLAALAASKHYLGQDGLSGRYFFFIININAEHDVSAHENGV